MTTYELATAVAVIKNLMAMGKLTPIEAVAALWDLVIEASPTADVHYIRGTSRVVDRLIEQAERNGG